MYTIARLYRDNYWADYYIGDDGIEREIFYFDECARRLYFSFISMLKFVILDVLFSFVVIFTLVIYSYYLALGLSVFISVNHGTNVHSQHYHVNESDHLLVLVIIMTLFTAFVTFVKLLISISVDFTGHYVDVKTEPSLYLFMEYYGSSWDIHQSKIKKNKNQPSKTSNDTESNTDTNTDTETDIEIESEDTMDRDDDAEKESKMCNNEEYTDDIDDKTKLFFLENKAPCIYTSIDSYRKKMYRKYDNKNLALRYSIIKINTSTLLNSILFRFDPDSVVFYYVTENGSFYKITHIDMVHRRIYTSNDMCINVGINVGGDEPSQKVYKMYCQRFDHSSRIQTYISLYDSFKDFEAIF